MLCPGTNLFQYLFHPVIGVFMGGGNWQKRVENIGYGNIVNVMAGCPGAGERKNNIKSRFPKRPTTEIGILPLLCDAAAPQLENRYKDSFALVPFSGL